MPVTVELAMAVADTVALLEKVEAPVLVGLMSAREGEDSRDSVKVALGDCVAEYVEVMVCRALAEARGVDDVEPVGETERVAVGESVRVTVAHGVGESVGVRVMEGLVDRVPVTQAELLMVAEGEPVPPGAPGPCPAEGEGVDDPLRVTVTVGEVEGVALAEPVEDWLTVEVGERVPQALALRLALLYPAKLGVEPAVPVKTPAVDVSVALAQSEGEREPEVVPLPVLTLLAVAASRGVEDTLGEGERVTETLVVGQGEGEREAQALGVVEAVGV